MLASLKKAKEYFDSIVPSHVGLATPLRTHLSTKVYEVHINRLLREKDTTTALKVLELLEEYPSGTSLSGQSSDKDVGEGSNNFMESLVRKQVKPSSVVEDNDQLQAIIDEQLEGRARTSHRRIYLNLVLFTEPKQYGCHGQAYCRAHTWLARGLIFQSGASDSC